MSARRPLTSPQSGRSSCAARADRLTREIHTLVRFPRARGIALVEDEIEDVEDGAEARVSLLL
jgi:hypothetical protein